MTHAIERTSPKGGPFIGTCTKCGAEHLPMSAVHQDCPADDIVSDETALLDIISKPNK